MFDLQKIGAGVKTWCLWTVLLAAACASPAAQEPEQTPTPNNRLVDLTSQWTQEPVDCLWNFYNLYNPNVVLDPQSEYPYKMWFFGWSVTEYNAGLAKSDAIFHARSRDLKHWEVWSGDDTWDTTMAPRLWKPVTSAGEQPKFDSEANGDPSVVLKDGQYHMAFSSVGFDIIKENGVNKHIYVVNNVMGATSRDGIHWTKTERPILIWDQEYTQRWELIPGQESPPPTEFYGGYHRPSLMFDQGRWRLWFDYFHPGTFVSLGYAENDGDFTNPEDWKVVRAGKNPLLKDWPNPEVVKAGNMYYAFCDAPYYPDSLGGDTRQLTMARSKDGLDWEILGHIRPEGLASSHVPQALVLPEDGKTMLYLFYAWKPPRQEGKPWDFRYKKIRYIKRELTPQELGE